MEKVELEKWLGAFALVAMVCCLAVTAWVGWQGKNYEPITAMSYYPSRPDSNVVSLIEANAEITLPPSAHDIYVYTTGFQDIFTKVRFSMSADEIDEFIASTLCREPLKEIQPGERSAADGASGWWTPNRAKYLKGCTGSRAHSHQAVMVDMSDPNVYVVFVSTSTYK